MISVAFGSLLVAALLLGGAGCQGNKAGGSCETTQACPAAGTAACNKECAEKHGCAAGTKAEASAACCEKK